MSEENPTQVVTPNENQKPDGEPNENGKPQLTYEELQAELSKVRREAAEKRVKNKELDSELEAFRKWKESQMTEAEKLQAQLKELSEARKADAVEVAQAKYGLEDEDLEFLRGETKEEILASAQKLAARLGRKQGENQIPGQEVNPNLFPGTRGNPVGSGRNDPNDFLRAQLRGEV